MDPIQELRKQYEAKVAEAEKLVASDPTKAAAIADECDGLLKQIDDARVKAEADAIARKAVEDRMAGHKRASDDPVRGVPFSTRVEPVKGGDEFEKFVKMGPFKSAGHFAMTVRQAGDRPAKSDNPTIRAWQDGLNKSETALKALLGPEFKASTGLNEFSDSEGGVLVPTDIAAGIWKRSLDSDFNLLSLMNTTPVTGNSMTVKAYNDKSRADGSRAGGVLAYWKAEADQYTSVKPTFRTIDLRLEKLTLMVPMTDEMLEDAPAAAAEINRVASDELTFKVNDAIIRGTGVGMPLGLMNAGCKIAVVSNNGANTTISATDIDNMWAQRARASGMGYVWLANQDCEPQLAQLKYVSGSTPYAAQWLYVPAGGLTEQAPARLKGKPLYYIEQCETLGTEGDIILFDPTQIAVAVKSTGIQSAVSMHLRFDYGETLFRFTLRMDARPYWETSLTRFKGSNALSPVLTLETTRSS